MATDARFDRIGRIVPHGNADSLEIAVVSNFPCIVRKGEFSEGDDVFYIRDDAKLLEAAEYSEWLKEGGSGTDGTEFKWRFPWQEGLVRYLGSGGRCRTVKLRGKVSMGILLRVSDVLPRGHADLAELNARIADCETGETFLGENFGVGHWTAPVGNVGDIDVLHQGLDFGLAKSDEENWENLPEEDLHLGGRCIVTKKLDGASCTVICRPDGEYSVASRSQTFNLKRMEERGESNIYTVFTKDAVKAGLWFAGTYGKVIALRGEICCGAVQNFGINRDRKLDGFFVYGCEFPEEENWFRRHGVYGTGNHFLEIARICRENGRGFRTVPLLCGGLERTVTRELLREFNDSPAEDGEGAVVNVRCEDENQELKSLVWHYKSKSREYLGKIK